MAWNWKGLAVVAVIGGGIYGYNRYSETANMCGRTETAGVIATILKDSSVGTEATISNVSTLKSEGNETFCSSTFTFNDLAGKSVSKDGIEYTVHPTDDHSHIYVQLPGTSIYRLKN